jgi:chromatin remodeling complex protein RSC6
MPRKQTTITKSDKPLKTKKDDIVKEEEVISDVEAVTAVDVPVEVTEDSADGVAVEGDESKDSISDLFDEAILFIETEIASLKDKETKNSGVKFLRSVAKKVKNLKHKVSKTMKQKRAPRKSTNNANSGFLKPVGISKELAKFGGWNPTEEISRVSVTKSVCAYIKDNNLQNPVDRRQILPDAKLAKLLNYDAKKESVPLTYYKIQSHLKPHFIPKAKPIPVA